MQEDIRKQLVPGARVRVVQHILRGTKVWDANVRGTVVAFERRPTGSWFAHAKDDKLWLDRLVIRKDDGEISTLNLDQYTEIAVTDEPRP